MKRYRVTGLLPQLEDQPLYGDFSSVADYQTALNAVIAADAAFAALPSDVRARFENDASKFLEFVDDAKNMPELVELGLAEPRSVTDVDRLIAAVEKLRVDPAPSE